MTAPGVSIIVPVYNAGEGIRPLLDSFQRLDYPKDMLQIIVVDNGSTDNTMDIIRQYPVTVAEEKAVRSSYAARNKGLSLATHEVLAFTDADCVVSPDWVRTGVKALENAELAGGKIAFLYSKTPAAAELFDSLHHMQNEDLIKRHGGSATANLFTKASVFKAVGPFREDVRSGGDMMWTRKAATSGFRLVYAPEVVVHHPTRKLGELLGKAFRLGTGTYRIEKVNGRGAVSIGFDALRMLLPPRPRHIRDKLAGTGDELHRPNLLGIWWVMYLYRALRALGTLYAVTGLPLPPGVR